MKNKIRYFAGGMLLAITLPVIASFATLGRMELGWPDAGQTNITPTIQSTIQSLSDNMPARINEFSGVADNTTTTITHNFGLNSGSLGLALYLGVGDLKSPISIALSGYTVIDNLVDPKNKIDITTPLSGSPHSFTIVVEWVSGGSGGSDNTKDFVLSENIGIGEFVNVFDDAGTPKLKSVLESIARADSFDNNTTGEIPVDITVSFTGIEGKYIVFFRSAIGFNFLKARVVDYNSGTPIYGAITTIEGATSLYPCAVYNPVDKNIIIAYASASTTKIKMITVSGTVPTVVASATLASINPRSSGGCDYNEVMNTSVFAIQDDNLPDNAELFSVSSSGGVLNVGTPIDLNASFTDAIDLIYSTNFDSILIAARESTLRYYLYRQTALSSYTLLDTDLTSVKNVFFNDLSEDVLSGSILSLFKSFTDSNKLLQRGITVSGDTINLGVPVAQSTSSVNWNPRSYFNSQIGKIVTVYQDGIGNRVSNTVNVSGTTATFGTEVITSLQFTSNVQTGKSKSSHNQIVICGRSLAVSSEFLCDFRGGNKFFNPTKSIGVLSNGGSTAGSIGTVTLFGGTVSSVGTSGEYGYIDSNTGSVTPSLSNPPIGIFISNSEILLQRGLTTP